MVKVGTGQLLREVEEIFPFVDKPLGLELSFHKDDCYSCTALREELEPYNGKEIPPNALRLIHQEMSCLSAKGWSWVLPSYLRYCLTKGARNNEMEIEFLIYNFGPDDEYVCHVLERLSDLSEGQIRYLEKFFSWLEGQIQWSKYHREDIEKAIEFLRNFEKLGPE